MLSLLATTALWLQPAAADPVDWVAQGEATLAMNKAKAPIDGPAMNVILFIADGMDVTTVTAARILAGQNEGKMGEEHVLAFETLPYVALSKTYNTNMQTPDSAGTATAMVTGHKTKAGVVNVDQSVPRGDCAASKGHELKSIAHVAAKTGRAVGVVSTARITHATPATVYASAADRNWENDTSLPKGADCPDIASQLIDAARTLPLTVVLGGGRSNFLTEENEDPEYTDKKGQRRDGRDLTTEWAEISAAHQFIWNEAQFDALDATDGGRVLGLFDRSHMQYDVDRPKDGAGEPSIAEMTGFAIERLSQEQDGYFLMVEGGRVDHAHHAGNAHRALYDAVAFDQAVQVALEKTDASNTLIIVTADHGHTMALQGYPQRGNPILGTVVGPKRDGSPGTRQLPAADGKPYTTLSYANGPGSPFSQPAKDGTVERPFVTTEEAQSIDYRQQALIPAPSESHGGQDVAIYAGGPKAYLLGGVVEQNYIYYVMRDALTATGE